MCEVNQLCKWDTWYIKRSQILQIWFFQVKDYLKSSTEIKKNIYITESELLHYRLSNSPFWIFSNKDFLASYIIKWLYHVFLWKDPPKNPFWFIISTLQSLPPWVFQAQITWLTALTELEISISFLFCLGRIQVL